MSFILVAKLTENKAEKYKTLIFVAVLPGLRDSSGFTFVHHNFSAQFLPGSSASSGFDSNHGGSPINFSHEVLVVLALLLAWSYCKYFLVMTKL